jgi:Na+-driven multidrug efflux pump
LGVVVVISSALSGAGATRACLVIDATILLGVVVPLTVVMWRFTDLTPTQTWYLIAIGNLLSAIGYAAWFSKKKWIHKVV